MLGASIGNPDHDDSTPSARAVASSPLGALFDEGRYLSLSGQGRFEVVSSPL
jgi:hypothetical protein